MAKENSGKYPESNHSNLNNSTPQSSAEPNKAFSSQYVRDLWKTLQILLCLGGRKDAQVLSGHIFKCPYGAVVTMPSFNTSFWKY